MSKVQIKKITKFHLTIILLMLTVFAQIPLGSAYNYTPNVKIGDEFMYSESRIYLDRNETETGFIKILITAIEDNGEDTEVIGNTSLSEDQETWADPWTETLSTLTDYSEDPDILLSEALFLPKGVKISDYTQELEAISGVVSVDPIDNGYGIEYVTEFHNYTISYNDKGVVKLYIRESTTYCRRVELISSPSIQIIGYPMLTLSSILVFGGCLFVFTQLRKVRSGIRN